MYAMVYHGDGEGTAEWGTEAAAVELGRCEWADYIRKPFESHEEYIAAAQLKRISEKHDAEMLRKDKKTHHVGELAGWRNL